MTALLEVHNVSRSFGALWAVRDVSLAVQQGELLGLIGPNGAGKSTLYNLIAGALKPTAGTISFCGQDVTGWPAYKMARAGVARTFQIPEAVPADLGGRERDAQRVSARPFAGAARVRSRKRRSPTLVSPTTQARRSVR